MYTLARSSKEPSWRAPESRARGVCAIIPGPVTFRELINHYGGAQSALDALPDLLRRSSRGRRVRICPSDVAEAELEAARRIRAIPLFTIEPGYPVGLVGCTG